MMPKFEAGSLGAAFGIGAQNAKGGLMLKRGGFLGVFVGSVVAWYVWGTMKLKWIGCCLLQGWVLGFGET